MPRLEPRIFYFGMVSTPAYTQAIRQDEFVGAASGKMMAVVRALRSAGSRAVLVSLPFISKGPIYQRMRVCRTGGALEIFLPVLRSASARKLFGAVAFLWFAIFKVRQNDSVLVYNHALEYILAVLALRIRRVRVFQDIEDVPTNEDRGVRGYLDRVSYAIISRVTSKRKVTVSNQVGRNLNLEDFIAIQGVASGEEFCVQHAKWEGLNSGGNLKVHFGGSLMPQTGSTLFIDTIEYLSTLDFERSVPIEFVITGIGDFAMIREAANSLKGTPLRFRLHEGVSRQEYFQLLEECHVSLSLKAPQSELAATTFPSKVIEITSRGLSLVSTNVSDVSEIFGESEIWLLPHFDARILGDLLIEMARNPSKVYQKALTGQAAAVKKFSPSAVGSSLKKFLMDGQAPE